MRRVERVGKNEALAWSMCTTWGGDAEREGVMSHGGGRNGKRAWQS